MASPRMLLALVLPIWLGFDAAPIRVAQGLEALLPDSAAQEEEPEPEEPDPAATDAEIVQRLRTIFGLVEELEGIEVRVSSGVVQLSGEVGSPDARRKAEELAAGLDGVVYVSNELRGTSDVSRRIAPSLEKVLERLRELLTTLPLLVIAALVFLLFVLIARGVDLADRLFSRFTRNRLVQGILKQVARTVVILCGLFVALEILGATAVVGAVLGTAGVIGIAIGFAFRDIIENYLASILLSVRRPFRSRDLVEIDGRLGTVLRMTTRDTVLMTPEGNHLSLPNAAVFKSSILNFTRNPLRRFDVAMGVSNEAELQRALELGVEVLRSMAGVVDEPAPFALIEELGPSSVNLRFFGWVDQRETDFGKARSEAVRLLKAVMDEHGVDMPAPIYQVDLRRDRAEPAATAARPRAVEDAARADVAPVRQFEEQIERDLALSTEENLLGDADGTKPVE